ncbi:MAG: Cobalamin synthesis C-terminus [Ilumatobacteraceae bacterium]|nr:Cobalamin synthesis C-terminus [Ilumatobacteraceae bacterium]
MVVGIGLNARATTADVLGLIDVALAVAERHRDDIVEIATIEHRRGHPALAGLPWPVVHLPVDAFTGRDVAGPAARLRAPDGVLLVPKRCSETVCVAVVAAG